MEENKKYKLVQYPHSPMVVLVERLKEMSAHARLLSVRPEFSNRDLVDFADELLDIYQKLLISGEPKE